MNYEVGDMVLAINYYDKREVIGKVIKIERHYAVYIEREDGTLEKLQRRHWYIDKMYHLKKKESE